jgi:hypothetical protein
MNSPGQSHRQLCPRCGSRLSQDERSVWKGLLVLLPLFRRFRCTKECGWRGIRFSRSRFRRSKRRLRILLIFLLFFLAAAATVRVMLSRVGPRSVHDEGIQEIE